MSPGGTAAISIPSEPNFMCSGLVTVAPFFGSMKNTRGFRRLLAPPASCLGARHDAEPGHEDEDRQRELLSDFHKRSPLRSTF